MLADKAQLGEQSCRGNSPANCNAACPTAWPRPSKRIHPQARTHRLPSCSRANASRSSTAAFLAASQVRHSLSWRSRSARNSVSACGLENERGAKTVSRFLCRPTVHCSAQGLGLQSHRLVELKPAAPHLRQQRLVLLLIPLGVLAQVLHNLLLLLLRQQGGRARPPVELEEAVVRRPARGSRGQIAARMSAGRLTRNRVHTGGAPG